MKIGIFAYNFPHLKTQMGLNNLCVSGYKPDIVFAADPIKLNFYQSKIRTAPKDLFLTHPKELCAYHKIPYHVAKHNSTEVEELVSDLDLDLGIILGARILKPIAFNNFNIGVMNMHPGILPENRGLDTIKWAIEKKLPQGVTSHLINKNIDRGLLIKKDYIDIYDDDTLIDIQLRIQHLEQKIMLDSIKKLTKNSPQKLKEIEEGCYHKSMPPETEDGLDRQFRRYKTLFTKR